MISPKRHAANLEVVVDALKADNERLRADNERLRTVLAEVEWDGRDNYGDWICPCCFMSPKYGHASDCLLSSALKGAGK